MKCKYDFCTSCPIPQEKYSFIYYYIPARIKYALIYPCSNYICINFSEIGSQADRNSGPKIPSFSVMFYLSFNVFIKTDKIFKCSVLIC